MTLLSHIEGTYYLFKFFGTHTATLRLLPNWLRNPQLLDKLVIEEATAKANAESSNAQGVGAAVDLVLSASNTPLEIYESDLEDLKVKLRRIHKGESNWDYKLVLVLLYAVRFAACGVAMYSGSIPATIGVSLFQFVVAPYSLFVAYCLAFVMGPPQFVAAYLVNFGLSFVLNLAWENRAAILPAVALGVLESPAAAAFASYLTLKFTLGFIAAFFVIDQLLCAYCCFFTDSISYSPKKILTHITWGFINCKTYYVVLLALLYHSGKTYSLIPWVIDVALNITPKLSDLFTTFGMNWSELFYHQHRMGHLPRVYDQAHKLHHYLHGATAFDAHIYGSGMPEEWFLLVIDAVASIYMGLLPASFNHNILYHSWTNKVGHTEQPEDHDGNNFHSDHHIHHRLNFGIFNCLLDVYFGTAVTKDAYNFRVGLYSSDCSAAAKRTGAEDCFLVTVEKGNDETTFTFKPQGGAWKKKREGGEKIKAQ